MIYFVEANGLRLIKIGYANNVERRFSELAAASPVELALLGYREGSLADERALHARYADIHAHHEWFFATLDLYREARGEVPRPDQIKRKVASDYVVLQHECAGCGVSFSRSYRPNEIIPRRPYHSGQCMREKGRPMFSNRTVECAIADRASNGGNQGAVHGAQ